jgi:antitoxin ParD1/3/4
MSNVQKRTFSLAEEQAEFIDAKVATGQYASASEVVREGLRALKDQDEAIERWLREKVAPAYDAMEADPSRGVPLDTVRAELKARHAARLRSGK